MKRIGTERLQCFSLSNYIGKIILKKNKDTAYGRRGMGEMKERGGKGIVQMHWMERLLQEK